MQDAKHVYTLNISCFTIGLLSASIVLTATISTGDWWCRCQSTVSWLSCEWSKSLLHVHIAAVDCRWEAVALCGIGDLDALIWSRSFLGIWLVNCFSSSLFSSAAIRFAASSATTRSSGTSVDVVDWSAVSSTRAYLSRSSTVVGCDWITWTKICGRNSRWIA